MMKAIRNLRYPKLTLRQYRPLSEAEMARRQAEFDAGTVPPIIVDGNFVIDGMQRVETAKILGMKHIHARQCEKPRELLSEDIHQITPYWSYEI